jgi:AcrR family transcriptional regulator
VRELFRARLEPLNARRLELLRKAGARPGLEAVVRAFLTPTWELWNSNPHFIRMAGRLHHEPDRALLVSFVGQFRGVAAVFGTALRRSLGLGGGEELFWRMHFVVGAMIHTWSGAEGLRIVSRGRCRLGDGRRVLDRLVAFCVAGLAGGAR